MAKTALPLLLALALLHAGAALAQAPREITVTADSAPGWVPSDDQIPTPQRVVRAQAR